MRAAALMLTVGVAACARDPRPDYGAGAVDAPPAPGSIASSAVPPRPPEEGGSRPATTGPTTPTTPTTGPTTPTTGPTTGPTTSAGQAPPRGSSASAGARGLWIWELGVNGPSAERAAALAASWGVRRVFLKSGNGATRGRWARNFSAANRAPFVERGIEVWAFAYVYGEGVADADGRTWGSVDEQIAAVSETIASDDVAGLVVDAELELVGRPDDARRFCAGFRARLGAGQRLAYTTFGWIQRWKDFPFEELDRGCGDAFLPQVYFAHGWPGGAEGSLARLREGIAARGLRAPVWPVQTNMPNPTAATLASFFALAGPDASVFFLHPEDTEQTRRLSAIDWLAK